MFRLRIRYLARKGLLVLERRTREERPSRYQQMQLELPWLSDRQVW